jgi:hypothetical protein
MNHEVDEVDSLVCTDAMLAAMNHEVDEILETA